MSQTDIESRIVVLENEISSLKTKIEKIEGRDPWWKGRAGLFEGDSNHAEAMRLGREWREAQRLNGEAGE